MYEVKIRDHNVQAHLDVENEIKAKNTGQMTFTLRINGGNIVDLSIVEYVDIKKKYAPSRCVI